MLLPISQDETYRTITAGGKQNLRIETPYFTIESEVYVSKANMNHRIGGLSILHLEMIGTGVPTYKRN